MKLFGILKHITIRSFWSLLKLGLRYPLFAYPTFKATKTCLSVSTQYFGRAHYQNTPANAFRHAFWNYLIAMKCTKWSKNISSILTWTKAITDWHEDAFRNRELARLMDLHNNAIGRSIFLNNHHKTIEEATSLLLNMTDTSVLIEHKDELHENALNLVHISN